MPTAQDTDIGFGKFLIAQKILTPEQVRESYQLLLGYRQKMPKVNLAQVLARHEMASKDALRTAYQQYMASASSDSGAPLPSGTNPGTNPGGSAFGVGTNPGTNPGGSAFGAPPEPKPFGFQTVDLSPSRGGAAPIPATIDPDRPAPGSQFGGGAGSAFGAPAGSAFGAPSGSKFGAGIPPTIDPESNPGSAFGSASGSKFGSAIPPTIDPEGGSGSGLFGGPPGSGAFGAPGSGAFAPASGSAFGGPGGSAFGNGPGGSAFGNGPGGSAFGNGPGGSAFGNGPGGSAFGNGPGGSAFGNGPGGSAFGSGPGGSAFGSGPGGSAFGGGPGSGFNEGVTVLDRGGPNGTHADRRGPGGTHAGPGGTHPHASGGGLFGSAPGGSSPGNFGSAPGGPGSKGALLDLIPQRAEPIGSPVDLDDDDEDDDHEDTNVQSSTFGAKKRGAGRSRRPGVQQRKKGPPLGILAGVAGVVVLLVGFGVFTVLKNKAREEAKASFMDAVEERSPKEALEIGMELDPDLVESDEEISKKIKELQRKVAAQERRAEAEEVLAKVLDTQDLDERLELCNQAIEVDEKFSRAYVERARVKFALAKRQALDKSKIDPKALTKPAVDDLRLAIKYDSKDPWSYYVRADILLETGRGLDSRSLAIQDLERVQSNAPDTALAMLAEGRRAALSRKYDRAIELYDQAIDKDPRLLDGYLARAESRLYQGNYAGALRDANEATDSDPNSSRALTLRAQARYHANNDRQGALADLEQALKFDPANGAALGLRAYVRLERDSAGFIESSEEQVDLSEKDARQALLLDGTLPMAHLALAEVLMDKGEKSGAISAAGKAVEYSFKYPEAYLVRARLRIMDGDSDHAYLDLEQVLQLEQDNARAMTMKASILIQRRDLDQARTLLERALELDRNLPQAFFSRGYLSLQARPRNYRKALEDFSEALGLKPTYADAYFYRAVVYHDQKRYEDAIQDLKQAEELRKTVTRGVPSVYAVYNLHLVRGHCHYAREEWAEAKEDYSRYIELAPVGGAAIEKVRKRKKLCEEKLAGQ